MKKVRLLPVLCAFVGTLTAFGQAPRPHSFSLDAEAVSAGGSTHANEGTKNVATGASQANAGLTHQLRTSQTQTTSSAESVQITVRNFGAIPDTAHTEWYFVAVPVKLEPGKPLAEQEFVFDQGTKDISLAGNGTQTFTADSKEITASVQRNDHARVGKAGKVSTTGKSSAPKESGSKLHGWVVRVVADGKTVAVKGSSQDLEDIAKDDAKLHALVSE